ncbi:hypothetical protein [Paraburkholderia sp. BL10I2N1]|nr:hypothetical protein [Paraburkholderia sp. BL10I2N1]
MANAAAYATESGRRADSAANAMRMKNHENLIEDIAHDEHQRLRSMALKA